MNIDNGLRAFWCLTLLLVVSFGHAATEQVTYVHTDHLGSPVLGRSSSGATVYKYDYKPYGQRDVVQGTEGIVGYTGHYQDNQSGLIYARARWIDPDSGRFLSPDSVLFDKGGHDHFSRYSYANNSPFTFADSSGNDAVRLGAEVSSPFFLEVAAIIAQSIFDDLVIPEGYAAGAVLSFPSPMGAGGEWGFGVSIDGVMGAEVSLDVAGADKMTFKSGFRPGVNVELDWVFDAKKASDVTHAQGHTEVGGSLLVAGGQVSLNKDFEVRGVGLKLGPGVGLGFNINQPMFGWSTN